MSKLLRKTIVDTGLVVSFSEANRLIAVGGVKVNGEIEKDIGKELPVGVHRIEIAKRGNVNVTIPEEPKS